MALPSQQPAFDKSFESDATGATHSNLVTTAPGHMQSSFFEWGIEKSCPDMTVASGLQNFRLEDRHGAPDHSALASGTLYKLRRVTPVGLEAKPPVPAGSLTNLGTTCCSPSLAMMQQSMMQQKLSANKAASSGSRRKLLARKPSVTFQDELQPPWRPKTYGDLWLSPENNSNVAKPQPIRLKNKQDQLPSCAGYRAQPQHRLDIHGNSEDGLTPLFPPRAVKSLYPSPASVASVDVVKTTPKELQLQKAPVKARRSTTTYTVVPVAQNLLQAYAREERRHAATFSASAFAPYGNRTI